MIGEVANHVWQSSVFAAGVWLLTLLVRRNHARVRYWLWFAASVKFLLPFALLTSLANQVEWAPATQQRWSQAVPVAVAQINEPFSPEIVTATPAPAATVGSAWSTVAFLVWGLGVTAVIVVRLQLWRRVRQLVRLSKPTEILDVVLPDSVQVRSAPGVVEPGVIGIFRPILMLPAGIQEYLPPRQLQAVLAHELCHVRRRDNLTAAIHMLAEGVFWFHPLVWWIGGRLVEAREHACDEDVLRELGDPDAYAEGILNVCKMYVRAPLVCMSGVSGANLGTRLEAIVSNRRSRGLTATKAGALVVAGVLGISVPVALGAIASSRNDAAIGPDVELLTDFRTSQIPQLEVTVPLPTVAPATAPHPVQATPAVSAEAVTATTEAVQPQLDVISDKGPIPGIAGALLAFAAQAADASGVRTRGAQTPSAGTATFGNRAFIVSRADADRALERQLEDALNGRAANALSVSIDATFTQMNSAEYRVPVVVRIAPLKARPAATGDRKRIDFMAVVSDHYNIVHSRFLDEVDVTVDPEMATALATTPIVYETAFVLLPGRYKIRALVRDQGADGAGASEIPFTVPNLNRRP